MKKCPNCGTEVNQAATGCPECGARWNEHGAYVGVPEGTPAYEPVEQPSTVGEMSPSQFGALLRTQVFVGAVLAILAVTAAFWFLGLLLAGCSGGFD